MIDALLSGRLAADPKPGTSSNGNGYATARLYVQTNADDSLSVSVIAFEADAVAALLAASKGDTLALAGELTPKVWKDQSGIAKPSADMKAHAVLTPYHVTRKRKAATRGGADA